MQISHRLRRLAATLLPIALCAGIQPLAAAERTQAANDVIVADLGNPPTGLVNVPKSVRSDLLLASDGNIYFASAAGGLGAGAVGRLAPDGTLSVLYAFAQDGSEGLSSFGGLMEGSDHNLYGTTYFGGHDSTGVVFKVTLAGQYTVLHEFKSSKDIKEPRLPYTGLAQGGDGNFYGTTRLGGDFNKGAVYRVTADGTFSVIHSFDGDGFKGDDGNEPQGRLVLDTDGNFYGTTMLGGVNNRGVIYRISTDGVYKVLYSFPKLGKFSNQSLATNSVGANSRASLLRTATGVFYGTANQGGEHGSGTLFRVTVSGDSADVSVVHAFEGWPFDGSFPLAAPVLGPDGNFYGTSEHGGYDDDGTVWQVTPDGSATLLHSFSTSTFLSPHMGGTQPYAGVLFANSNLYGVNFNDPTNSVGLIYRLEQDDGGGTLPVNITVSKTTAYEEESIDISWSAPNAVTCDKFGGWEEPTDVDNPKHITLTSGSESVTPFVASVYTYGLACTDAAGVIHYGYAAVNVTARPLDTVDGGKIIGGGAVSLSLLALLLALLFVKLIKETRSSCP